MIKNLLTFLLIGALALLLYNRFAGAEIEIVERPVALSHYAVLDKDQRIVPLSTVIDKPTLLAVWTVWCGYCKRDLPQLDQLLSAHKDQFDFDVLPVVVPDKPFAVLLRHIPDFLPMHGSYIGQSKALFDAIKLRGIPSYYLLDGQGNLRAKIRPNWKDAEVIARINQHITTW